MPEPENLKSTTISQTGTSLRAGYRSRNCTVERYCLLHVVVQGSGSFRVPLNFFAATTRGSRMILLPRDAMHKRGLCRHAVCVCVSVRPSITFVDHVKTNKPVFKIFHHRVSPPFYFFPYQASWHYSDGDPPKGGIECKGSMKKCRFSTNISLYLRNDARYSHSYYGRRIGNRTQAFEWYQFQ